MTAPRQSDPPDTRAWMLPRYGLRAAITCWAVAALLATGFYACAKHASGQEPAFPASVPLRTAAGVTVCRVTPMAGGAYSAGHCVRALGRLYPDGLYAPWSVDPTRDLAHFAALYAPAVVMRAVVDGEVLYWRNDRASGAVTAMGTGWQVQDSSGWYDYVQGAQPRGEAVVLGLWRGGARFAAGDSGSGLWGADGALVGILVTACTTIGCVGPQTSAYVAVP